jgi:uncharacterized protein (DUF983 family)
MANQVQDREMDSHGGMRIPSLKEAGRLLGRGMLLRCPNCGKGPVLKNWLKLRVHCGHCCIRLERGEHDYFMGSMLLNYCLTGALLLVGIAVLIVTQWPDVPWDALQWGGPISMVVLPFILFPFSKLLFLAADIMMRPVTPEEMEWHRTASSEWSSERAPRSL